MEIRRSISENSEGGWERKREIRLNRIRACRGKSRKKKIREFFRLTGLGSKF